MGKKEVHTVWIADDGSRHDNEADMKQAEKGIRVLEIARASNLHYVKIPPPGDKDDCEFAASELTRFGEAYKKEFGRKRKAPEKKGEKK